MMKRNLASRMFSLVLCLCLLMSAASFDRLSAIAESPETAATPTDVDGDGPATVDDLRQLLAQGYSLAEAQSRMPLTVLDRAIGHDRFEAELWSDAQGTQRERMNRAGVNWRDIPSGAQCDDALNYHVGNYPAIEGYAAKSLMHGDQYVTAMIPLAIGDAEYLYVDTVRVEDERKIEGYAILAAGEKLMIRYVAEAQEPAAETEPLPGEVLAVQAMIDALPTAADVAAMDMIDRQAAYAQTQAAYEAYEALPEEQRALIIGAEAFEALFAFFNGQIMTLDTVSLNVSNGSITITDEGYQIGSGAVTPHTGDYIITGSSIGTLASTITVNAAGTVNVVLRDLTLTGHQKTIWQIESGIVYATLEGSSTLQCDQDYLKANAVGMGSGAELHFDGSGTITIHGSSNYWEGGDAINGGNVYIHGGTVTLVGGNKIENNFGKCFNGESITVDGGNLNYYQGVITSNDRGTIAGEAVFKSGTVNGKSYTAGEVPVPEAESTLCTSVTLKAVSDVKYRMDSGAWQESPIFTGLAAGSTHTFYQTRILEDPYFLTDSVTSVTIRLRDHDWGEPVFDGISKGTHTKTCPICELDQTESCSGGTASYFQQAICTVCAGAYETYLTDTTAPTGSMRLGQNIWTTLLNTITFELFFHDAQTITIQATDDSCDHDGYTDDKAVKVTYFIHGGDAALTREELDEKSFVEYADAVSLTGNGKYTVYARLTDWADNVTYLSSSGIVIYADAEQITAAIAYTRTSMTDVPAQVKLNGNTVRAITLNGDPLEPGTDYTVDGGNITFKAGWLDALAEGGYTLIVSYDPQGKAYQDGAANDAPRTTDIALTVSKAEPQVVPPEPKPDLVYDGASHELVTAGSTNGGTMVYSLTEDGAYVESIPTGMNAGDYQVWYKVIGNDSYLDAAADCVTVTIAQAEQAALNIANRPESVTYGDDPFTLLAEGGSGEGAVTWAVTVGADCASIDHNGQVTVIGAGDVVITATKAADSNHKAAVTAEYAFTVKRKALTPSIVGDTVRVYDGTRSAPEGLSVVLTGLVFNDGVTASARNYAYDAAQAGPRTVMATGIALGDGEKAVNYVLTADAATVPGEITAKTIDIGTQTFVYDGGDTFTVQVDGVTLEDDTVETITVTMTTDSRNVGDYASANEGGLTAEWDNDNYMIIIDRVTIEPLTAELVWSDVLTFTYDGGLHGITATVGNRRGDDDFALTYENNEAIDAGEYVATVTGLGNGNYALPEDAGQVWKIEKARHEAPVVTIDFFAETLAPNGVIEYSLNGADGWRICEPGMPVTATGWDGTEPVALYIRYAENENYEMGEPIKITIPARPGAPEADMELIKSRTAITVQASDALTGCEYALDGSGWQTTRVFDGLTAGTEYTLSYRTAATETSFASFSHAVKVTTVNDNGSTTLQPGETVEAGGNTVTNDGDRIILTDENGNTTTVTPAKGAKIGDDGTVTVPENGTVQTGDGPEVTLPGGGTVAPDGTVTADEVIVGDTTVKGKDVRVAADGTVTVPEGTVIEDDRFGRFTAPEGGGAFVPGTGEFTPANGAGSVSAEVQVGANTPVIRIDMSEEALRDAALDDRGKWLVAWGWDAEILLNVEGVDGAVDARTLGLIEQAAREYAIGLHLEITLSRTIGNETEAIHETATPIRLVIEVPRPFENDEHRSYAVVRVHEGKAELLPDEDGEPDAITISTDRFSTYTIVYRATATPTEEPTAAPTDTPTEAPTDAPTEEPTAAPTDVPTEAQTTVPTDVPTTAPVITDTPPRTGDDSMLCLWVALLLFSGAGMAVAVLRMKSKKK